MPRKMKIKKWKLIVTDEKGVESELWDFPNRKK